jgi:hypothetical protein
MAMRTFVAVIGKEAPYHSVPEPAALLQLAKGVGRPRLRCHRGATARPRLGPDGDSQHGRPEGLPGLKGADAELAVQHARRL